MNNKYILKMLEDGKIKELKKVVQDEIYQKELSNTPYAKQRYVAMQRYFKYSNNNNVYSMPCVINGKSCLVDGFSAVRTSESIGNMKQFEGEYFKIDEAMNIESINNYTEEIDFNEILAEAKNKGYKYKKCEIGRGQDFTMVFLYNNAYFKVGILDQAFSVINDGHKAEVFSTGKALSPIKITTSIGECILLPVKNQIGFSKKTVIKIESKYSKEAV